MIQRKSQEYWEAVEGEQAWQYLDDRPWHLGGRIRAHWLLRMIRELEGSSKSFLDAGCAEGLFVTTLSRGGFQGIGCDISLKLLGLNSSLFGDRSILLQSDISALPFREKIFSLVLCSETLEHIPEWREAFREIVRVCDGSVLISIPNYESFLAALITFLSRLFLRRDPRIEEPGGHVSIIRLRSLLELLKETCIFERIVASHAFFSFPSGYWPHLSLAAALVRVFPPLTSIIRYLDLKFDEKLWKVLITFAGSIIILGRCTEAQK